MTGPRRGRDGAGAAGDRDPHRDQPVITAGAPAGAAEVAVVLLHGRGATAQGIVNLADPIYRHGVAFFAPQAARSRWYPYSSSAPIERNEPAFSSALRKVGAVVDEAVGTGIPLDRVVLFGFSQGACLASEFAARNPRRYGGVVALGGGFVGPDDASADATRTRAGATPARAGGTPETGGSFEGAPAFFGCGADDERVSIERIRETAAAFRALDAAVTERVYEGLGHAVSDDELDVVGELIDGLLGSVAD